MLTLRDSHPAKIAFFFVVTMGVVCLAGDVLATNYVVSTSGNDNAAGSNASPWRTIERAVVTLEAGDTLFVSPGVYTGFRHTRARGGRSGAIANPIVYKALGDVLIDRPPEGNDDNIFVARTDHIVIDGFRATGSPRRAMFLLDALGLTVKNCTLGAFGTMGFLAANTPRLVLIDNTFLGDPSNTNPDRHAVYVEDSNVPDDRCGMRGNVVYGQGVVFDARQGAMTECVLENNVIYGTNGVGLMLRNVQNSIVQNNVLFDLGVVMGDAAILFTLDPNNSTPSRGNMIVNNTVLSPRLAAVKVEGASSYPNYIFNNILMAYQSDRIIVDEDTGGRNQIAANIAIDWNNVDSVSDLADLLVDTRKVSEQLVVRDVHLVAGSSAIDAGRETFVVKSAPDGDFEGGMRPVGDGHDIGADEYASGIAGPPAPASVVASGTNTGCLQISWSAEARPRIIGYTIYYGSAPGQYGDSVQVDVATSAELCGLADGRYYVAARARGLVTGLSALSAESMTIVTDGATSDLLPPQEAEVVETTGGCVWINWRPNIEPELAGYVIYYGEHSVADGQAPSYAHSFDVGLLTAQEVCDVERGANYFAVRAYDTSGGFSGYSTEKSLDVVGPDTEAPFIMFSLPGEGALEVPRNTKLAFLISDSQTGVDTSSVSVLIDGLLPASVEFFGDPAGLWVACELAMSLSSNTSVGVFLSASDLASPPNTMTQQWSFRTSDEEDFSPPTFCCHEPPPGAKGVVPGSSIRVGVSDGAGVDPRSVRLLVAGVEVDVAYVRLSDTDAVIELENMGEFDVGEVVRVHLTVCDYASNCDATEYEFEVSEGSVSNAIAAIVPDGYWADDPNRPLEVRDIPLGWTVRVFDTAGSAVRSFENRHADGYDWTWDFTNDQGQRVAASLYLIRVVDKAGGVVRSGRFVVRSGG